MNKPLIGIAPEISERSFGARQDCIVVFSASYAAAVRSAGGLPVLLPVARGEDAMPVLSELNGLILPGDLDDVPPRSYGADSDPATRPAPDGRLESDRLWVEAASELAMPVLGICFGAQALNVLHGGTLIQDIGSAEPACDRHFTPDLQLTHSVHIEAGTLLSDWTSTRDPMVSSTHRQAIDRVAEGWRVSARSPDGVIEAIELDGDALRIGVQWHPELHAAQPDWVLSGFLELCMPGAPH